MSTPPADETKQSHEAGWSPPVSRLKGFRLPTGAINLNVDGRQVVGPLQGFGQLWQKTYRVRLTGVTATPAEVVQIWKENFSNFWPAGSHFYPSLTGIAPGEVAVLNLSMPGGMPLSTGMLVLYVDEESFTLMTPEGHFESGWITFGAHEEDGCTVAQVQSMARANDPMYEIGFILFAHRVQEDFWHQTLLRLASHFGVKGQVQMYKTCVDPRWQWSQIKNIWHNAAIRTALYTPIHLGRRLFKKRKSG
jgi:hypothetical protein